MNNEDAPRSPRTEFPRVSHAETRRLVREAERMRAEHLAGFVRSAGHGIARLARALMIARPLEGRLHHGLAPATPHPDAATHDPFRPQPRLN